MTATRGSGTPAILTRAAVVHSYVGAYNHRDFATMTALHPSMRSFDQLYRHRALGTMKDVKIAGSRPGNPYGRQSPPLDDEFFASGSR